MRRIPKHIKKTARWTEKLGAQGARMDLPHYRHIAPPSFQETAKKKGISTDTYYRIRYVNEHGTQEVNEQLKRKEISVNKAYLLTRPEAKPKSRLDRGSYKVIHKADKARLTIETNAQNLPTILRALERLGIRNREPENE